MMAMRLSVMGGRWARPLPDEENLPVPQNAFAERILMRACSCSTSDDVDARPPKPAEASPFPARKTESMETDAITKLGMDQDRQTLRKERWRGYHFYEPQFISGPSSPSPTKTSSIPCLSADASRVAEKWNTASCRYGLLPMPPQQLAGESARSPRAPVY